MKSCLSIGMIFALSFAAFASAATDVSICRLEETRTSQIIDDKVGRSQDRLQLTMSLKGPEAQSAVRYGNVHIDEAVDDRGTSLIPEKDSFNKDEKFQDYSNAFFRKNDVGQNDVVADPQVEIDLGLPKRIATKIAHLRGSFEIAEQGTIKTIEVPDIAKPGSKKLDIPPDAGVTVTTTVSADEKKSIGLKIGGDENVVESIEVVDGSGKEVSNGMSSWTFGNGPAHKSLDLNSPLDQSMKLVVKIAVNRKLTKVPFDLRGISLP